jgi:hypothetical protein
MSYRGRKPRHPLFDNGDIPANSINSSKIIDGAITVDDIGPDAVGVSELSATGSASTTTFLRGDNTWSSPGGGVTSVNGVTGAITAAHIATAVEAASNSHTFNDADHTKLNGIETSATADQTAAQILTLLQNGIDSIHYVNGSIDNEHIADNAIDSEHYADNSVDALHLNISGNGTTNDFLRSDGDGSFSWVVPTNSNTTYQAGSGISLTGTTFANTSPNVVQTTVSGNAGSATILANARTISLTGDVTGSVSFNGSGNVAISTSVVSGGSFLPLSGGTLSGNLSVTGAITASGDITSNSDERLKSNIRPIDNALGLVLQLDGVRYTKDNKESIGLIAQEVQKVLPEFAHTANDEMKTMSLNYSGMVSVLIEAIKDQQEQIDNLKEKLNGV